VRAAVDIEWAAAEGRLDDVAALAQAWREASAREQEAAGRDEKS